MNTKAYLPNLMPALLMPLILAGLTRPTASAERLEVRIYRSVAPGMIAKDARGSTRLMLDLMGDKLDLAFDFDLVEGETAEDLDRFGEEINRGSVHLGAMWGLEYGWLHGKFRRLEPLVICAQHEALYRSQFMVRRDFNAHKLADLEGKRLAMYPRLSLVDRIYVHKLLEERGNSLKTYFRVTPYPTPRAAIFAVNTGDADCVLVNMVAYGRYISNRPGTQLREVEPSHPFPEVVLIGRRDVIEDIRDGLWEELRRTLETIHLTDEGEQCVDFWKVARFKRPDNSFETLVRERLQDYPIKILSRLD